MDEDLRFWLSILIPLSILLLTIYQVIRRHRATKPRLILESLGASHFPFEDSLLIKRNLRITNMSETANSIKEALLDICGGIVPKGPFGITPAIISVPAIDHRSHLPAHLLKEDTAKATWEDRLRLPLRLESHVPVVGYFLFHIDLEGFGWTIDPSKLHYTTVLIDSFGKRYEA